MNKKTLKVLSIDYDFFLDTTIDVRNNKFPDGADDMNNDRLKQLWLEAYEKYPEIYEIKLLPSYYKLLNFLADSDYELNKNVFFGRSHKEVAKYIVGRGLDTFIDITNVDFHHDYYNYFTPGDKGVYNCGNWLRKFYEEDRKGINTNITWIRSKDSDIRTLGGEFPHTMKRQLARKLTQDYDFIFICLSPEWVPTHLKGGYSALINAVMK